jgi:GTP pyrophosphokinase
MDNHETNALRSIILAPYLQLATALIGKSRRIGGNQFRHVWATVGILIDHKIIEPAILKAGVLHDLKEDAPLQYFPEQIRHIDIDGPRVVELIEELSIRPHEAKSDYLLRVMTSGSREAKLIKLADRISNLTDIQLGVFDVSKVRRVLFETEKYIIPFAKEINENMYNEILDLVDTRTKYVHRTIEPIVNKVINNVIDKVKNLDEEASKLAYIQIENSTKNLQELLTSQENKIELEKEITRDIEGFVNLMHNALLGVIVDLSSDLIANNIRKQMY